MLGSYWEINDCTFGTWYSPGTLLFLILLYKNPNKSFFNIVIKMNKTIETGGRRNKKNPSILSV